MDFRICSVILLYKSTDCVALALSSLLQHSGEYADTYLYFRKNISNNNEVEMRLLRVIKSLISAQEYCHDLKVDEVSSQQLVEFMDSGIDFFSRMNPGAKHLYKIAKS